MEDAGKGSMTTAAIILIAVILVFGCVYLATTVIAPVVFALFMLALMWPFQSWMQERMPKGLALAVSMIVVALVFVVFGWIVAWAFGRVTRWVIADAGRFQALYTQGVAWLDGHGIAVAGLWAEHFNVGWAVRAAQHVTGRFNTTMTFWLVVFVYVILGLLEVDDAARKIKGLRNQTVAGVMLRGSALTAAKLRKYMLVRTLMSIMTGALVWAFATAVGLPLAAEWGVIAFALNYIPFIGPLIATVFPTLFAMAQFQSWEAVLVVFACLNIIQFVVGSYLEPRVAGSALSMSPFLVLFSVFFWSYLWGILGAFIGVPISIAVLTFCAQHPSSSWFSDLLGAPPEEGAKEAAS